LVVTVIRILQSDGNKVSKLWLKPASAQFSSLLILSIT